MQQYRRKGKRRKKHARNDTDGGVHESKKNNWNPIRFESHKFEEKKLVKILNENFWIFRRNFEFYPAFVLSVNTSNTQLKRLRKRFFERRERKKRSTKHTLKICFNLFWFRYESMYLAWAKLCGWFCTAMNTRKMLFDFLLLSSFLSCRRRQVIVKSWIPFGNLTDAAVS